MTIIKGDKTTSSSISDVSVDIIDETINRLDCPVTLSWSERIGKTVTSLYFGKK